MIVLKIFSSFLALDVLGFSSEIITRERDMVTETRDPGPKRPYCMACRVVAVS